MATVKSTAGTYIQTSLPDSYDNLTVIISASDTYSATCGIVDLSCDGSTITKIYDTGIVTDNVNTRFHTVIYSVKNYNKYTSIIGVTQNDTVSMTIIK